MILVEPYSNKWPQLFEKEKSKLKNVFQDLDIQFFHIGSTAIPGCYAKPLIDILGVTKDVTKIDLYNQAMVGLGYEPLGEYGMRQRRFFRKKEGFPVNLHIFEDTNPEVERHLRFCRYLRKHPDKVKEYSTLKKQLAAQFPTDRDQYTLQKDPFIKTIDIAAAWEASERIVPQKQYLRKKSWTPAEIQKAMMANMQLHMTYFAKYLPVVELVFEPDVTVVRSEIPDDTFNYVLFAKFTEKNAQQRIIHVLNLFKTKNLPFSWWVGETDRPAELQELLKKQGLRVKEEDVGMYLELEKFQMTTLPPLRFHHVTSIDELKKFAQVIVEIGGHPKAFDLIYSQLPPILYKEGASFEMHIGYLDQTPVVTGILVLDANVAGIYYVATVQSHRKKGYGSAMMKYLLNRAKSKGYFLATLQASHEGKSLYERLGFKKSCIFIEFVNYT
ncbi:MAG TPA: bifunctional GrpB family protein/GNAT family N-acetyltransferase [Rhabdochlamydiaceae bacterium]|nr:bifunctional GrpB family protein/GNAT family N-acetyltransferase [Rhabdochlamydiaceae bacterium]